MPSVGAFDAFRTEAIGGPAFVVEQMRRLHRGDYAERSETREIFGGDYLSVFDSIAPVARAICFLGGGECVESNSIGAVTDGVKRELKAGAIALDCHLRESGWIEAHDAGLCRIIGVGSEERSGSRTEGAIEDCF